MADCDISIMLEITLECSGLYDYYKKINDKKLDNGLLNGSKRDVEKISRYGVKISYRNFKQVYNTLIT